MVKFEGNPHPVSVDTVVVVEVAVSPVENQLVVDGVGTAQVLLTISDVTTHNISSIVSF